MSSQTGGYYLPSPSYWPIILAFGLPIMAYGVIYNLLLIPAGAAIWLSANLGWGGVSIAERLMDGQPLDLPPQ